jgi:hypothetical protein
MATVISGKASSHGVAPVLAGAVLGFLVGIALASVVNSIGPGSTQGCGKQGTTDRNGRTNDEPQPR